MNLFRVTGNYGTFEITRTVEAVDKAGAFAQTGISDDLRQIGWEVSEVDGEEWEVVFLGPVRPTPSPAAGSLGPYGEAVR